MLSRPLSTTGLIAMLIASSFALSLRGTALAQQDVTIYSTKVDRLPDDPAAPAWAQAPAAEIELTPQILTLPRLPQVSVSTVSVRSLNDGKRVAFRLEWTDQSRDAHATKPNEFRDAAAIMFPVGDTLPNICMGSPTELTNIWHWKGDWQEDIDKGFQEVVHAYPNFYKDSYPYVSGQPPFRYPTDFASDDAKRYFLGLVSNNPLSQPQKKTPVEELIANGFGTATHYSRQNVAGKGVWENGRWKVMFVRDFDSAGDQDVNFNRHAQWPIAFAVWNGSNQESGSRKQTSAFSTVRLTPLSAVEQVQLWLTAFWPFVIVVLVVVAGGVSLRWFRRRARAA